MTMSSIDILSSVLDSEVTSMMTVERDRVGRGKLWRIFKARVPNNMLLYQSPLIQPWNFIGIDLDTDIGDRETRM